MLIQVAKYLNVPPWELAERPMFWLEHAQAAMNVEFNVQKQQEKKANRTSRSGR